MRKLLIGLLAVVFVLGMSSGVMADPTPTEGTTLENNYGLDNGESFDVNVTVEEFAHISELPDTMNFTLDAPATQGDTYEETGSFEFATNTDVNVRIDENLSEHLPNADLPSNVVHIEPYLNDGSSVDSQVGNSENDGYAEYDFDPGEYDTTLGLAIGWYYSEETDSETANPEDNKWWEVIADDYNGEVTVTISAQQQ